MLLLHPWKEHVTLYDYVWKTILWGESEANTDKLDSHAWMLNKLLDHKYQFALLFLVFVPDENVNFLCNIFQHNFLIKIHNFPLITDEKTIVLVQNCLLGCTAV
jgi:hypothetical protein